MTSALVKIEKLPHCVSLPNYQTDDAAGADLSAAIDKEIILLPFERCLVPTGIRIQLPKNYEAQIRPRSGLALKNGIIIPNAPGTIDADYRGEIKVIIMNCSNETFKITRGMRIAQMIVSPIVKATFKECIIEDDTARGTGGFGSTGTVILA